MTTLHKVLRWICFVPAGIVAAALVALPIHWLVMINLGGWSNDPVIEIRNPETLRVIEYFLQGVFGPMAFIYVGARIAPVHKRIVSVVLTCIIVLGLPIFAYWWNSNTISNGEGILINHGFATSVAQVVGAAGAIFLIYFHVQKGSDS